MPSIAADAAAPRRALELPDLNENTDGWGPGAVPASLREIPYAPFSKSEPMGKAADWTRMQDRNDYYDRDRNRRMNRNAGYGNDSYGASMASAFAYIHTTDDDASFSLVDRGTTTVRKLNKPAMRGRGGGAYARGRGGAGGARGGYRRGGRTGRGPDKVQRLRESSVVVKPDWTLVDEIEFNTLSKLSLSVEEPDDLAAYGSLLYCDKAVERVNTKFERPLVPVDRTFYNPTTRTDPALVELADKETGPVIVATDNIVSTIMCATRSVYSWDVVVVKEGNRVYFDKRDGGVFDFVSVNENALNPPPDTATDKESSQNTAGALALEATYVNCNFSQQVLKDGEAYQLPLGDPFYDPDSAEDPPASAAYRYRRWDLGDNMRLLLRTTIGAVATTPNAAPVPPVLEPAQSAFSPQETIFVNVKALTEVETGKTSQAPDWRSKLDAQRGAVLAYEMKNNANKMAKWTLESILAGVDQIRIGFVTRVNAKDRVGYVARSAPGAAAKDRGRFTVVGLSSFKPREVATQMNLNVGNSWGILKTIASFFLNRVPDGKYVLMRDPNKPALCIYEVPLGTFETEDDQPHH